MDDLKELVAKGRKFHTIYADPPWRHPYSPTWGFGFQQFETMTIEDIMALPIRDLVAPDAHLHIWIVPAVWWRVKEIVKSWGFDSSIPHPFSWYKDGRIGMGNIWRANTKPCFRSGAATPDMRMTSRSARCCSTKKPRCSMTPRYARPASNRLKNRTKSVL